MSEVLAVALVYVVVLAAGDAACVRLALPARSLTSWLAARWLLGTGLVALVLIAMHAARVPFGVPVVAALVAGAWLLARLRPGRERGHPERLLDPTDALLLVLFLAALVHGLAEPIYLSDPINIYGLNARVFETERSLAPERLKALLEPGHIEYPPLVSLNEALLFLAGPGVRERAVKPLFALFFLAFLALARDAICSRISGWRAWLLLSVVALTPELRHQGARGFADLPLAAFLLAFVLWLREAARAQRPRWALAAGLALGCAALTKNEGFALAVLAAPALAAIVLARRLPWRFAALAAAPGIVLGLGWLLFREAHGIESDLFQPADASAASTPVLARIPEILGAFARVAVRHDQNGSVMWGTFWFGFVVIVVLATAVSRSSRRGISLWSLALLAHFALYVAIFVITPRNLDWQLTTAAERLVLHWLPWVIMVWIAALEPVMPAGIRPSGSGIPAQRAPG